MDITRGIIELWMNLVVSYHRKYLLEYFFLFQGSWDETGFGFKVQSSCVTHSNSQMKSSTDFVFVTANSTATPSFSGYVVFARNSYAALVFPLIIM